VRFTNEASERRQAEVPQKMRSCPLANNFTNVSKFPAWSRLWAKLCCQGNEKAFRKISVHFDGTACCVFCFGCFFALLIPAITDRGPRRSAIAACMSNQRQIVIGFTLWKDDHHEQFLWQASTTNSGTTEYALKDAASNFQILSNYLGRPEVFVCPTDKNRVVTTNFA
jgi:hypothetical protein